MADEIVQTFNEGVDVNRIGFGEFTANLIGSTTDAVVAATLKQIESFSDLVKEIAPGMNAFKAKAVTARAVADYMRDAFPNAEGTDTAIREGATYNQALYMSIIERLGEIDGLEDPGEGILAFDSQVVEAIREAVTNELDRNAEDTFNHLKTLLELGYARVVFTNGRIRTRLNFNVTATGTRTSSSSDVTQRTLSRQAGIQGGFRTGLLGILGISGGARTSSVTVSTVQRQATETSTLQMMANIAGEVEVNFATQTFNPVSVEAPAAAS